MTENSTGLAAPDVPEALRRKPIIELLHEDQVKLIAARAQAGSPDAEIKRGELAAFLELAASYQLDPFSGEVWLAKSKRGKVLIMVGRDGLRKIAQRNGLRVYGDVIYEKDEFRVTMENGAHHVVQAYGHPKDRGALVGAWVLVLAPDGSERGYFVATAAEYKPTSPEMLKYSPWGSQESVMLLAAAERQALRQATPLSGLVAQGEDARVFEEPVGEAAPEMRPDELRDALADAGLPDEWARPVRDTVRRAQKLGHAGHGNAATVEMLLRGQPVEKVRAWLTATNDDLDLMAGNPDDVPDADPKTWPAWWCATCGQKNAGWANACGRCVTVRPNPDGPAPRDWQQPHPADAVVVEDGDDGEPVPSPIRVRSEEEGGPPQWDPENLSSDALRKMAAGHRAEAASVLAEDPMADNAEDMAHQLRDEAAQFEARAREMDEFVEGLKADPAEQPGLEGVE